MLLVVVAVLCPGAVVCAVRLPAGDCNDSPTGCLTAGAMLGACRGTTVAVADYTVAVADSTAAAATCSGHPHTCPRPATSQQPGDCCKI